jgi:hypothetical protein
MKDMGNAKSDSREMQLLTEMFMDTADTMNSEDQSKYANDALERVADFVESQEQDEDNYRDKKTIQTDEVFNTKVAITSFLMPSEKRSKRE